MYDSKMLLRDRTVVVTGGASGLGGATVDRVVAAGGQAVVLDVDAERGAAKAASHGARARFIRTDVTSESDLRDAIDETKQAYGRIDGVVNAAGIVLASRVLGRDGPHSLADFARIVHVNLVGTFNVTRLVVAAMADNPPTAAGERGVVVTTASVAAFDGQIGQAAYAASKAGIVGLTLPLAREFARIGVRVMTIAPGTFDTPLLAALPEAARVSLAQQVPFPSRLGRPDEYAALVRHIFENEMLNGEVIRLDGAIRMAPK
jgi:NAD(P)-dependent dehydrogenase (short-subunit alcohol dehydrogenase family)